jgi:hypothetical protein
MKKKEREKKKLSSIRTCPCQPVAYQSCNGVGQDLGGGASSSTRCRTCDLLLTAYDMCPPLTGEKQASLMKVVANPPELNKYNMGMQDASAWAARRMATAHDKRRASSPPVAVATVTVRSSSMRIH